jgi:hypothetical protein
LEKAIAAEILPYIVIIRADLTDAHCLKQYKKRINENVIGKTGFSI